MNKAFLLTICLLLTSFTGCIETDDSDLETVESVDEVIDENNNTVDETNNTVDETSTTEVPPTIILFVSLFGFVVVSSVSSITVVSLLSSELSTHPVNEVKSKQIVNKNALFISLD